MYMIISVRMGKSVFLNNTSCFSCPVTMPRVGYLKLKNTVLWQLQHYIFLYLLSEILGERLGLHSGYILA